MSWCAETDHGQLGNGTVLSIFEQSWESGLPVRALRARATLAVRFPHGAIAQVNVVEVSTTTGAIVRTSNGTTWRMIQVAAHDLPLLPPDMGEAPTTHWRITGRIDDLELLTETRSAFDFS
jgi:hypothetical protein